MKRALIGITPDTHDGDRLRTRISKEKIVYIWDRYLAAFLDRGAMPVVLPVTSDRGIIASMALRLDGVVLAGGNFDVPPEFFAEEPKPWLGKLKPERSRFELDLLIEAAKKDLPVLGICGGMQAINVAFGGTLYQDIAMERPGSRAHSQKTKPDRTSHQVTIASGTRLHSIMTGRKAGYELRTRVNSTHHQAVKDLAPGFAVNAQAADGIIEGIESTTHGFIVGVQWHPEILCERHEPHARIIRGFLRAVTRFSP
jgi:putative glutamine amidotransferase